MNFPSPTCFGIRNSLITRQSHAGSKYFIVFYSLVNEYSWSSDRLIPDQLNLKSQIVSGVSLPEGVALNFLIERAMEWQEKVRPLVNRYKGIYTATDKQSKNHFWCSFIKPTAPSQNMLFRLRGSAHIFKGTNSDWRTDDQGRSNWAVDGRNHHSLEPPQ